MPHFLSKRREPFEFMLYLGIIGSIILFLFIIFVFIKNEFQGQSIVIHLPKAFWVSTWLILISSLTLTAANRAFKAERFRAYRFNMGATLILGFLFIFFQFIGWQQLYALNQTDMMSNALVYILSGLHIIHTLGGVIALSFVNRDAFTNINYVDLYVYSVNPPNQLKMKLISIYWHFVDALWIGLFLYLLYHAS